jgi:cation transport ATPase
LTRIIQSLSEISDGYDAVLCDLWGCLHNGIRAFPEAVEALRRQGVKHLYLVSHEYAGSLHPNLTNLPLDGFETGLDELEKLRFIQDLLDRGQTVGLVSDGLFRAGSDCLNLCLGASQEARPLDADVWLMPADIRSLASAHQLAGTATARLRRSHRGSQASKGAMLMASSFDLLPPSVAAALGNTVTLGMMRYARKIKSGDAI